MKFERTYSLEWKGKGERIEADSFVLIDPMIYASEGKPSKFEVSCIEQNLMVGKPEDATTTDFYYPSYAKMHPNQRAFYLKWLQEGRVGDLEGKNIGYAFTFFYGLERRLLIDREDCHSEEFYWIIDEVLRLLNRYTFSKSFDTYLSRFVTFAVAKNIISRLSEEWFQKIFEKSRIRIDDDALVVALNWIVQLGKPIAANWAMRIAESDPRSYQGRVLKQKPNECRAAFEERFRRKYPGGLWLNLNKREQKIIRILEYQSGNISIQNEFWKPTLKPRIMDVLSLRYRFDDLIEIWNIAVKDMKK